MLLAIPPATAQPQRIVSINLCTDQIVLALDPGARLAAVSELARDPALSSAWRQAHKTPVTAARLEAVLGFQPDLVLAGGFGHGRLAGQLERLGIEVARIEEAASFADIRDAYLTVGRLTGLEERALEMIRAIDEGLPRLSRPRGQTALILSPGLLAHSDAMLGGAVLRRAGYENAYGGGAYLGLETIAAAPPDKVFIAASETEAPSRAARLLSHPVMSGLRVRRIPPAPILCGSIETVRLAARLAREETGE